MVRTEGVRPPGVPTLLVNIVAVTALCGLIAFQAMVDRRQVVSRAYEEVSNLSDALAAHTRQTFAALDLGLITLVREVEERGRLDAVSRQALNDLLFERQAASPATQAFYMLDAQGGLIGISAQANGLPTPLGDTPGHIHHRDHPDNRLFVSAPHPGWFGAVEGRRVITVSRRIESPDGRLAGSVGAVISLDHLLEFYSTLRVGAEGLVGLFAGDGTLIASSPVIEGLGARGLLPHDDFERIAKAEHGQRLTVFPHDGRARITGYRFVGDRQTLVLVGLGLDELLAPWRQRLVLNLIIAGAVIALFLVASGMLSRHLARRRMWEDERVRRLGTLAAASSELARARDEHQLLERATTLARELIQAHQAVTSVTVGDNVAQSLHSISLSDRYAAWRDYDEAPDGSGIYRLVCEHNQPMCLSQAELEAHPAWRGFGDSRERHPPMRGWLAVPIVGQSGNNLGMIQLSDKEGGDFGAADQAELTQLSNVTAIALENLRSMQGREEALAQIETIFNSISDGVAAVDTDWRFTYLNAEAERLLQRSRAELLGRNMWEAFPEGGDSTAFEAYRKARDENRLVTAEFFYPPLKTWFSVRAFPHENGLTIYFQDVSQRIETEEKLRQSQKMDAIGKLTGGVAHDFNNLLTVILGNADAILDRAEPESLPASVRKQAGLIRVAGERAAELTHRLLAFARRQPLEPVETDINELLAGVDDLLHRTLGDGIEVKLLRHDLLWPAVVDPGELNNAILNLAINARDAMPNGGLLTITTDNALLDAQQAASLELDAGDYVLVSVSDTGEGMPAEVMERAFEPFFTTKPAGKGSGLGLSMVFGFAKQSGGQISILSEVGLGTTVRIYLPRAGGADAPHDVTEPGVIPTTERGGGERILLVEDEELVREHTTACLQQLGYIVTPCADGPTALARLEDGCFYDLLLTDVKLAGGMSGREVAEQALNRCSRMKVLYVSGYTDEAFSVSGGVDPGVCLLCKPFRIEELARKLREMLDH